MQPVYSGLSGLVKHMILLPSPLPVTTLDLNRMVEDALDEATATLQGLALMEGRTLHYYAARVCTQVAVATFIETLGEHLRRQR